jgi:hypothetical protein
MRRGLKWVGLVAVLATVIGLMTWGAKGQDDVARGFRGEPMSAERDSVDYDQWFAELCRDNPTLAEQYMNAMQCLAQERVKENPRYRYDSIRNHREAWEEVQRRGAEGP